LGAIHRRRPACLACGRHQYPRRVDWVGLGGLTIALGALGETYLRLAAEQGIDPALLHRVAVMSAGTLDSLPHNGAVVTLLAVCGVTHRDSYKDILVVAIVGALLALAAVIVLGSIFGSF
jgi:H+/gluconate symporter-like permease